MTASNGRNAAVDSQQLTKQFRKPTEFSVELYFADKFAIQDPLQAKAWITATHQPSVTGCATLQPIRAQQWPLTGVIDATGITEMLWHNPQFTHQVSAVVIKLALTGRQV